MMSSNRQIKLGAFLSYFGIALNIVAGLLYTPWLVDQLGESQYGLFTLASSLIAMFMVDFGLGSAVAKYVSLYRVQGNQAAIDGILGIIYKLYILIDGLIFAVLLVLFFFLDSIYAKLTPAEMEQFKVVYCIVSLYSVVSFPFLTFNGILTAYEKFVPLKLASVIQRILVVGLTVLALCLGAGLYVFVAINAATGLIAVVFKFIVIRRSTPISVNFRYKGSTVYKDLLSFSLWDTVAGLAQRLVFSISPSILAAVSGSVAVAVFGVVANIESYVYTFTSAINGLFLPKISQIYTDKDSNQKLTSLLLEVGRFQFYINGLIVAGFALVGREFIHLWMGPSFSEAYYGVLLVILPSIFYNSLQIAHTSIIVQGKLKLTAFINVCTGILSVVLSSFLSGRLGMLGSCISIFFAYMLRSVLCILLYGRTLGIDMWAFVKRCYGRMLPAIFLTVGAGLVVNHYWATIGWGGLVLKGILILCLYTAFILLLSDKSFRKSIFLRLSHGIHRNGA